jgi:hypothetical protein
MRSTYTTKTPLASLKLNTTALISPKVTHTLSSAVLPRLTWADIRQCILYDSPSKDARLIGIEYMITPRLYETLPADERALWHSHVFEVKGGVLVMPKPPLIPEALWEEAELVEMEEVVNLYGKTYHLWQVDRGDEVPMGEPKLMSSFVKETAGVDQIVRDRNQRLGINRERKIEMRQHIEEPDIHPGKFPKVGLRGISN